MKAYTFFFALLCLFASCEKDATITPVNNNVESTAKRQGQLTLPEGLNIMNPDAAEFNRPCGVYWQCSPSWNIQNGQLLFAPFVAQDFVTVELDEPLRRGVYSIVFDIEVISNGSEFDVLLGGENVKVVSLSSGNHKIELFHRLTEKDNNDFAFFGVVGLFTIDNIEVRPVYLNESVSSSLLK